MSTPGSNPAQTDSDRTQAETPTVQAVAVGTIPLQSSVVDRTGQLLGIENDPRFQMIQIHKRELEDTGSRLAKVARKRALLASSGKALVILLGALVATKEVANQLFGGSNAFNVIAYAVAGLTIATATGLEAAFKWENTAVELKHLVAQCRATARKAASDVTAISAAAVVDERDVAIKKILEDLDATLGDVQAKAARLGVNAVAEDSIQVEHIRQ